MPNTFGQEGESLTLEMAKQALTEFWETYLDYNDNTIEDMVEAFVDDEGLLKKVGYVGALIWCAENPDIETQTATLKALEENIHTEDDESWFLTGKEQRAVYRGFKEQPELSALFDLFNTIKALRVSTSEKQLKFEGRIYMRSVFNIVNMNRNMTSIVEGMKVYIKQNLSKTKE